MNGYILLGRDTLDTELWNKPPYYMKLWLFFVFKAFFKDKGGLGRGELRTSYDEMERALSYGAGYRREKPGHKEIYKALRFMREGGGETVGSETKEPLIDVRRVNGGIIVRLLNYDKTQDPSEYEIPAEGAAEGGTGAERAMSNKEKSKNQKSKKEKYFPRNRFVNYEQRNWDFESLEREQERLLDEELLKSKISV